MPIQTFQVDPYELWMPYAYEREAIQQAGGEFVLGDCHTPADVIAQAQNAEILLLTGNGIVTPAVMDALPKFRLIIRWGVGFDVIDAAAATARGIAVANCPTYATEEVGEHAIALLMDCVRHISWFNERMRQGQWLNSRARKTFRLKGRTLGIIGLGRIGSAVAWRARGLGLRVIAHDRYLSDDAIRAKQVEPYTRERLLAEADIVSVHVPLNPETHHLINADVFAQMKAGALFINTSRGAVVDQQALAAALQSGRLSGAGLDVFEHEPLPADHALRQLEQVVMTPHTAAYSEESMFAIRQEICRTVADWMRDSWSSCVVNPEVRSQLRPRQPS